MIGDFIAQGVGTPSSIPVFLLMGLTPTGPIIVTPIEVCRTGVVSLMAARTVRCQTPRRHAASLAPTRTTRKDCCS